MYAIEHYDNLVQSYEELLAAMNLLCLHIHDELPYTVWVSEHNPSQEEPYFTDNKDKLIYSLMHFEPSSGLGLAPQETYACPGACAATLKTFSLIDDVNKKKDAFKSVVQLYHHIFKPNPTKPVRRILTNSGFGLIRLKQVYRHIKYITYSPKRISWTKAREGSNLIITKEEAANRLKKSGAGEHIEYQLKKLELLPDETKLVIHRDIKPYWIVNFSSTKTTRETYVPKKIRTSIPVFYLYDASTPDPLVDFGAKSDRSNTAFRSDKLIEDKPFLSSISAYRYKKDIFS